MSIQNLGNFPKTRKMEVKMMISPDTDGMTHRMVRTETEALVQLSEMETNFDFEEIEL